jgi:hypothetical protein
MSKPKVIAIQLATPHIDEFAKYSLANVSQYCRQHGYGHYVQRIHSVPDMHINWSKIDLIKHAFDKFKEAEYYVLFDADIVIQDFNKSVDFFLKKYAKADTHILFSADTPLRLSLKARPNAGLIIIKNSPIGKQIIDRWIEASRTDGAQYNDTHPRNQLVYWNCVMPQFESVQQVLPRSYFVKPLYFFGKQFMPTSFLYHLTQSDKSARTQEMKRMAGKVMKDLELTVAETNSILQRKEDYLRLV